MTLLDKKPDGFESVVAGLLGLSIFFPQPCIPLGGYNALQAGHVFLAFGLLLGFNRIPGRVWWIWTCLIMPYIISSLVHVLFLGSEDVDELVKLTATRVIEMLPFLATGIFLNAPVPFMVGALLGVGLELCLVMFQTLTFVSGSYPAFLLALQNNPQFGLTLKASKGVVRDFRANGLMPESSALWACVSSWLFIFVDTFFSGITRMYRSSALLRKIALGVIIVGSLCTFASGSGFIIFFGLASAIAVAGTLIASKRTFTFGFKVSLVLCLLLVATLATYGIMARMESDAVTKNMSWQKRADSIQLGLRTWSNAGGSLQLWGFMSNSGVVDQGIVDLHYVTSIVVKDIVLTGMVGLLVWVYIIGVCTKSVRRSKNKAIGYAIIVVLFGGIAGATAYSSLMPFWCALSILVNWDVLSPQESLSEVAVNTPAGLPEPEFEPGR